MQMRTVYRNRRLWLLFGFFTALGMMCQAGHAQECAQCAKNDASEAPLSTGEWLLTKEVNEVNVLFVALHKGKHVLDLTQKDITVEDDNKAPAAILGFRPQQELPLRVAMVIDTSSSVTSRFRFEQAAASVFLRQVVNRGDDLGFVLGFSNYPNLSQDFASDPELLSQGVARLTIGGGTAIYDALRASCRKLVHHSEQDVVARVLVLLSDGQNNAGMPLWRAPLMPPRRPKSPSTPSVRTIQDRRLLNNSWPLKRATQISANWRSRPGGECSFPAIRERWRKPSPR